MTKLYTCEEIAERYNVTVGTVWGWIRKKKLQAIKVGRCYRVRTEDIENFESSLTTAN